MSDKRAMGKYEKIILETWGRPTIEDEETKERKAREAKLAAERHVRMMTNGTIMQDQLDLRKLIETQRESMEEMRKDLEALREWRKEEESREFPRNRNGEIHKAICDGCDEVIVGHRFKCVVCEDYDLCADCEVEGKHSKHAMLRIPFVKKTLVPKYITYGHKLEIKREKEQKRINDLRQVENNRLSTLVEDIFAPEGTRPVRRDVLDVVKRVVEETEHLRVEGENKSDYDTVVLGKLTNHLEEVATFEQLNQISDKFAELTVEDSSDEESEVDCLCASDDETCNCYPSSRDEEWECEIEIVGEEEVFLAREDDGTKTALEPEQKDEEWYNDYFEKNITKTDW